jgi:uncharacterized protein YeaO (DUF488 family)
VSRAKVDNYVSTLAPSRDLLKSLKEETSSWREYEARYLQEMRGEKQRGEIDLLAEAAASRTVTLMCVCRDSAQGHRSLLVKLVEARVKARR